MKYRMHNTFLRNEANGEEPNYEAEGLHAKLAEFRAARDAELSEADDGSRDDGSADDEGNESVSASTSGDEGSKGDDDEGKEADDFEFPEIGSQKKEAEKEPDFDEAAFDAETEREVEGLDPKRADAWKKLKSQVKQAKLKEREAAELISNAKPAPEVEAKLARLTELEQEAEALRQRNRELLQANDQTAVRESEEFIAAVSEPLDSMAGAIKAMAQSAEMDAATLAAVIEEPDIAKQDKMLDALASKFSPRALNRIERMADDYKAIMAKEKELLADAGKSIERQRLERQQAERDEQARRTAVFQASVEDSFKNYASQVPGFTDSNGALTDLGKAAMAKIKTNVDISTLSPSDLGYLAFTSRAITEMRRELVKAREEISILRGSRKKAGDIGDGAPPKTERGADEDLHEDGMPMGLIDRMKGVKFSPVGATG